MKDLNLKRLIPVATFGALAAASCGGTVRNETTPADEFDRDEVANDPEAFETTADDLVQDYCRKAANCDESAYYSASACEDEVEYYVDEYIDSSTPECRLALVDVLACLADNVSCLDEYAAYYACEEERSELYYTACSFYYYYDYDYDVEPTEPEELPTISLGGAPSQ